MNFKLLALSSLLIASDSRKAEDIWVSMEERVRIWDEAVEKQKNGIISHFMGRGGMQHGDRAEV